MRKSNPKYKKWIKLRNHTIFIKEVERRKKSKGKNFDLDKATSNTIKIEDNSGNQLNALVLKAPENFSVIDNPNDTVKYFNSVIKTIKKQHVQASIFFDVANIKTLSIDSIMYLLAIINNLKRDPQKKYFYAGNYPYDETALSIFDESGFSNYVNSKHKLNIERKGENFQIKTGNEIDRSVAKDICDFVNRCFISNLKYTKFLYNMILELMTNTKQHAYNDGNVLSKYWYIYAKKDNSNIKFIFLDTGSGIPETITTKFVENFFMSDSELIESSLRGEFRTETKLKHRGKGLPKILKFYHEGFIKNLVIISGKGYCNIDNTSYDIDHILNGTLLYWELNNVEEKEEQIAV